MNPFLILFYTDVILLAILLTILVAKIVPVNTLCVRCAITSGKLSLNSKKLTMDAFTIGAVWFSVVLIVI